MPTPAGGAARPPLVRQLAVLTTGLSAGFFVTYTISVTRGLALVDDLTYVETFQAVNATVRTGWFAAFFFGALPLLVLAAWVAGPGRARWTFAVSALAYAVGVLGVTFAGNVPMNQDLATHTDLLGTDLAVVRAGFEDRWNTLNLARTVTAVAVFAAALVATTGWRQPAGRGAAPDFRQPRTLETHGREQGTPRRGRPA